MTPLAIHMPHPNIAPYNPAPDRYGLFVPLKAIAIIPSKAVPDIDQTDVMDETARFLLCRNRNPNDAIINSQQSRSRYRPNRCYG